MSERWEPAFVAVGVLVGEPLEALEAALGEAGEPHATRLLRVLGSASRETRARALARVVSDVAVAIDSLRVA